jgi:hypothetical protein
MGCIAVGIIVIILGWNGAAGVDFVQGQVPYLLSAGAVGISLVVLGAALIVVQNNRRDRTILEAQLRELNEAIARLANAIGSSAGAGDGRRTTRRAQDGDRVVLGQSSYHRPDCRLVRGKELPTASAEAARADGLSGCRICRPDAAYEAAPR